MDDDTAMLLALDEARACHRSGDVPVGAVIVDADGKLTGVVTDGGFRDSYEIAGLPFPTYHNRPSSPTNLTLHQAIDVNVPIGCGDVAVFPGDVVVGDAEGVKRAHRPEAFGFASSAARRARRASVRGGACRAICATVSSRRVMTKPVVVCPATCLFFRLGVVPSGEPCGRG